MASAHVYSPSNYATTITMRGHSIVADESGPGGTDTGPEPPELLLAALGSCAAITARMYANRKGWDLREIAIELHSERYRKQDYPGYDGDEEYVHEFRQRITFTGNLTEEQKTRLTEIAGRCPVHRAFTDAKVMIEQWMDGVIADE